MLDLSSLAPPSCIADAHRLVDRVVAASPPDPKFTALGLIRWVTLGGAAGLGQHPSKICRNTPSMFGTEPFHSQIIRAGRAFASWHLAAHRHHLAVHLRLEFKNLTQSITDKPNGGPSQDCFVCLKVEFLDLHLDALNDKRLRLVETLFK